MFLYNVELFTVLWTNFYSKQIIKLNINKVNYCFYIKLSFLHFYETILNSKQIKQIIKLNINKVSYCFYVKFTVLSNHFYLSKFDIKYLKIVLERSTQFKTFHLHKNFKMIIKLSREKIILMGKHRVWLALWQLAKWHSV